MKVPRGTPQKKIAEIVQDKESFYFVAQVTQKAVFEKGLHNKGYRKFLLRDETGLIYAFLYIGSDFHQRRLIMTKLKVNNFVKILVGRVMGSYEACNTVAKCDLSFCSNCNTDHVKIFLKNGARIEVLDQENFNWGNRNKHIPFRFTQMENIQNLKYGTCVDVVGLVSRIHWDTDPDENGEWTWTRETSPKRQCEIITPATNDCGELRLRCTVWGNKYKDITTTNAIIAIKVAKIDHGFGEEKGINVGSTCDIFQIDGEDDVWLIPDDQRKHYWPLTQDDESEISGSDDDDGKNSYVPEERVDNLPTPVEIEKAIRKYASLLETTYKMEGKKLGLILNNVDFLKRKDPERKGSIIDEKKLTQILKKMDFEVAAYRNRKIDDFRKDVLRFKSRIEALEPFCILVAVLSHGAYGVTKMVDEETINYWKDLVYHFSDKNCPKMKGKPKVFLMVGCQEFMNAFPSVCETESEALEGTMADEFNAEETIKVELPEPGETAQVTQIMKDTLVCFPCLPGAKSIRRTKLGTLFIVSLVNVLQLYWETKDFISILRIVQQLMIDNDQGEVEQEQMCHWVPLGFQKLFFNSKKAEII